ncbi:MAG: peptidylprolyl isomerase [Chloroflexota bacterium]
MNNHVPPEEKPIGPTRQIRAAVFALLIVTISMALGVSHYKYSQGDQPIIRLSDETITTRQFQYYVRLERQELLNYYFMFEPYPVSDYSPSAKQFSSWLSEDHAIELGQSIINRLINNLLIHKEAQTRGIQISETEIQAEIQSGRNRCARNALQGEITDIYLIFPSYWSAAPTSPLDPPTPFDQIMAQCAALSVTKEDYYSIVAANLLYAKMFDVITADVPSNEEEVWARHIMVKDQATALAILERIKNGEDFGTLAAEFSLDISNNDNGGDLGWFPKGVMIPEFEAVAFSTQVGQVSEPLQTQFGWHLIQILGHEEHRQVSPDRFAYLKIERFRDWLIGARMAAEQAGLLTIYDYWKDRIPLDPALPEPTSQPPE